MATGAGLPPPFHFAAAYVPPPPLPVTEPPPLQVSIEPAPAPPASISSGNEKTLSDSEGEQDAPPASARRVKQRKMHPCTMCHKSFDRPSTLRVHQRVHTLERDFACEKCHKRFSVLSNMKRHAKGCGTTGNAPAGAVRESTVTSTSSSDPPSEPKPKRPRRKGAPARWVPETLRGYTIGCTWKVPKPLPPITPHRISETEVEERNSFAVGVPEDPYSDENWTGRLPGPALKDVFLGSSIRSKKLLPVSSSS